MILQAHKGVLDIFYTYYENNESEARHISCDSIVVDSRHIPINFHIENHSTNYLIMENTYNIKLKDYILGMSDLELAREIFKLLTGDLEEVKTIDIKKKFPDLFI